MKKFTFQKHQFGFKILQGDGVGPAKLPKMLSMIVHHRLWPPLFIFGSGGALLQKWNRDSLSVAFKCCQMKLANGTEINVSKKPISDAGKNSLYGELHVPAKINRDAVFLCDDGQSVEHVNAANSVVQLNLNQQKKAGRCASGYEEVRYGELASNNEDRAKTLDDMVFLHGFCLNRGMGDVRLQALLTYQEIVEAKDYLLGLFMENCNAYGPTNPKALKFRKLQANMGSKWWDCQSGPLSIATLEAEIKAENDEKRLEKNAKWKLLRESETPGDKQKGDALLQEELVPFLLKKAQEAGCSGL